MTDPLAEVVTLLQPSARFSKLVSERVPGASVARTRGNRSIASYSKADAASRSTGTIQSN